MKREEEIEKAAKTYVDPYACFCGYFDAIDKDINAFQTGAEWADEHPKSPWISVKDRLPTRGGNYLYRDDNRNIAKLAFVGDKWINTRTFTMYHWR